jgi:hypothetical protein
MAQDFRTKFYKKITGRYNESVYLFKTYEYFGRKKILGWMSAYKDKKHSHTSFIVESGAGIPEKRMEKQITSYLKLKKVI